jgi:predicted nuclease of predicted toxin-antitoxin system
MTGAAIRLYLDENIWRGLTEALRQHGYDALHVRDANRAGLADELQLAYAAEQGRAVLTYNIRHFIPVAELWYEAGRDHAGIVLSEELEQGELLRRVLNLLAAVSAEEMANTVRFLQEFK